MSFLNITDPRKRESIVADYLATVKRLQDINERAQDLVRQDDLNRMFEPVIESTGKSTQAITKERVPIREEMKTLNERLAMATTGKMKDMKQQPMKITRQMFLIFESMEDLVVYSINISLFNALLIMRWVLKQLELVKILTSL